MEVPFLDLKAQNSTLKDEILPLWEEILESASFVGGKHVVAFEQEFAKACSVKHAIAVNSGTDALRFIFIALGLKPGDEVITVPNTFIATTEAISQAGAKPVFVDIDERTYNMDPNKLEDYLKSCTRHSSLGTRPRGVVPVHLYGQTAEMDPILAIAEKHGLWVVEDACQAHLAEYKGRKAGSIGIAAAFSFYPGKNMGACGEAGAVTTNDADLAAKVRMLRDHGQAKKYYHDMEGFNGRCDALQAAALRVKLKYLSQWNEARRRNAERYFELLKNSDGILLPQIDRNSKPVFHLFIVQVDKRDLVQGALKNAGVQTGLHYPIPLHLQKAYEYMVLPVGSFPLAEACAKRILSLPMFPELREEQIQWVSSSLKRIIEEL